ncbi:MAG: O-sialoglycoprotein endopeptidase [Actinobacteria bacterium]|nr:O-sialoglycoprotein endopeptidase [Actinomycetota bacterium]
MVFYLGLDTSFYTTSAAAVDDAGTLLLDAREPAPVPQGRRGLQPSQVVFEHVSALPRLLERLRDLDIPPAAVAASCRPRPAEGSYLPVFRVSEGFGRGLAAALKVPFFSTTHQEGHLMAGIWSARGPESRRFLAFHLSGGTTELLTIERRSDGGFDERVLGGTQDLHAGQFIDRVGVALGLPFPAGPGLERLAAGGAPGALTIPSAVEGATLSFSGPESQAARLISHGAEPADLARAVFACVARSVEKALRHGIEATGCADVLLVGGVASNGFLREHLAERLGQAPKDRPVRFYFAEPAYCTDNAVGVALLAREAAQRKTHLR